MKSVIRLIAACWLIIIVLGMFAPVQVSGISGITAVTGGGQTGFAIQNTPVITTYSLIPAGLGKAYSQTLTASGGSGSYSWSGSPPPGLTLDPSTGAITGTPAAGGKFNFTVQVSDGAATFSCELKLEVRIPGTVLAWGKNSDGQLGDGTNVNKNLPTPVLSLSDVVDVAAGVYHSLAVKSDGTVWGWGGNGEGSVGDGTYIDRRNGPVQVVDADGTGYLTDVIAVAAGWGHSLALKSDGTVWAWGYNGFGQLGDGTTDGRNTPMQVSGLNGITSIYAGTYTSFAVKYDGTVYAWGYNYNAQLGLGDTIDRYSPVLNEYLNSITSVSDRFALRSDGKVLAWGLFWLGNGNTNGSTTPVVNNYENIVDVAANAAVKSDGTVWCFGSNLGNGTNDTSTFPVQVSSLSSVTSVVTGSGFRIALKSDGTAWAWGEASYGHLGNGNSINCNVPVQVKDSDGTEYLSGIEAIATGYDHSLAIIADSSYPALEMTTYSLVPGIAGTAYVQTLQASGGSGSYNWTLTSGSLPDGLSLDTSTGAITGTPTAGGTFNFTIQMADGISSVTRALLIKISAPAALWSWGLNDAGQLGNGTTVNTATPILISDLAEAVSIAAGPNFSLAVKSNGTVWAWGNNDSGQLGDNTTTGRPAPGQVQGLTGVVAVAAGESELSLALKADGTVWAWGTGGNGALGNGTTDSSLVPVQVNGLSGITGIAAKCNGGMALKSDGTVWTWGYNGFGEIGDGTFDERHLPVQVSGLTGVTAIASRAFHGLALKFDGTVWAWGGGWAGQLGNNLTSYSNVPVQVKGSEGTGNLEGVVAIAAGHSHSLALKSDGTVWAWGENNYGQMGDGTTTQRNTPVKVKDNTGTAYLTGITAIAAGDYHNLTIKSDGTVWAWGRIDHGAAGDGTSLDAVLPVQVNGLTDGIVIAGGGMHSLALVATITNHAPAAVNDSYSTSEDTILEITSPGVLANDTDADSDPLTALKITDPAHGSLTFNADGSFSYNPEANYYGSDSFTYRANDGEEDSNIATVTITINAVNDPPVAVDDTATVDQDSTDNFIDVLANDSDAEGETITVTGVTQAAHGSVTFNPGGVTYTPNAGFSGDDSFTYTVSDGNPGGYTAGTVTVTVIESDPNSAPVAVEDSYTTLMNTTLTITAPGLLGNDTDADNDSLHVDSWNESSLQGDVEIQSDGSFVYNPPANWTGTTSFTYRVWDYKSPLVSDWATVTITVDPLPVVNLTVNETITVSDAPQVLPEVIITLTESIVVSDASQVLPPVVLAINESITVSDLPRSTSYAPVAVSQSVTTGENTARTITLSATDEDGDSLTYIIVSSPAHGSLSGTGAVVTYVPNSGYTGNDSFTFKANDGVLDSNTATVSIYIQPVYSTPGGGSDTLVALSGLTSASGVTLDSYGFSRGAGHLTTPDGRVTLDIPAGTGLRDANGDTLLNMAAEPMVPPPEPPPGNAVILAYEFGPAGATFRPPLTLTMAFDPASLPDNMTAEDLRIAYFDGKQWQNLAATLDTRTMTLTARISHFSVYAILGKIQSPATPTITRTAEPTGPVETTPPAGTVQPSTPPLTDEASPTAVSGEEAQPSSLPLIIGISGGIVVIGLILLIILRKRNHK
jgi:VCBS repeat-containing protein